MRVSSRPRSAEDQVDRHQHADRRHHLGRQHPHQDVLGALASARTPSTRRPGRRSAGRAASSRPTMTTELQSELEVVRRAPGPRRSSRASRRRTGTAAARRWRRSSGLEAVRIVQRIGKKISSATTQARMVQSDLRGVTARAMLSSLTVQVLADRCAPGRRRRCWRG